METITLAVSLAALAVSIVALVAAARGARRSRWAPRAGSLRVSTPPGTSSSKLADAPRARTADAT